VVIKTFPRQIKFDWLENIGMHFDTHNTYLILKNLFFLRGNGVILNKKLFSQSTYHKLQFNIELRKFLRDITTTKVLLRNNIYILTDIWSTGPYHFYVDVMSKLIELIDSEKFDINISSIILFDDSFTNNVIIPLFRDIGFEKLKLIRLKNNQQYIIVGKNYFVTKPHIIGSNNSRVITKVYNLINQSLDFKFEFKINSKIRGIYYSRNGRNRSVVNDNLIISELTKMGFYCTNFDDLSYFQAFRLMKETNIFVGIHGGGLTNMMFMNHNSIIVEIKNDNTNPNSHCYWHLARSLKFDYTLFVADTVGYNKVVEGKGCDLFVNWTELKELILEKID
jgi:hypothetical protein